MPKEKGALPAKETTPTAKDSIADNSASNGDFSAQFKTANASSNVYAGSILDGEKRPDTADKIYQVIQKKAKESHRKLDFLPYTNDKRTKTIAIKCYAEQLLAAQDDPQEVEDRLCKQYGFISIAEANIRISKSTQQTTPKALYSKDVERYRALVHALAEECLRPIIEAIDPEDAEVVAVVHDLDTVEAAESLFEVAVIKPHIHIWARVTKKDRTKRVKSFIKQLGVRFRITDDDKITDSAGKVIVAPDMEMYMQGGCQSIHSRFSNCLIYAGHQDKKSIKAGKHYYDKSLFITNMPPLRLSEVMNGADNASEAVTVTKAEMQKKMDHVATIAVPSPDCPYYELGDFQAYIDDLPANYHMSSYFHLLAEAGQEAQAKWYKNGGSSQFIPKNAFYIYGAGNVGKSYGARRGLRALGLTERQIYEITKNGTGKTDDIQPHIRGLIASDVALSNTLNLADTHPCQTYRRNSGEGLFCGDLLVITSNQSFRAMVERTDRNVKPLPSRLDGDYTQSERDQEQRNQQIVKAHLSRFTVIHAETEKITWNACNLTPDYQVLNEAFPGAIEDHRSENRMAAGSNMSELDDFVLPTGALVFYVEHVASRLSGQTDEAAKKYHEDQKVFVDELRKSMMERVEMLANPEVVKFFRYLWGQGYNCFTYPLNDTIQKMIPSLSDEEALNVVYHLPGLDAEKRAERYKVAIAAWRSGSQLALPGLRKYGSGLYDVAWDY